MFSIARAPRLVAAALLLAGFSLLIPPAPAAHAQDSRRARGGGADKWEGRKDVEKAIASLLAEEGLEAWTEAVKRVNDIVLRGMPPDLNGPFVPSATRRVFADPLTQVDEVLARTNPLLAAGERDDIGEMIAALAPALDHEAPETRGLPRRPAKGASLDAWLDYLQATLEKAKELRDEAFSGLTEQQMRLFMYIRPLSIFSLLRQTLYLGAMRAHNAQMFGQMMGVFALSKQIKLEKVLQAGRLIASLGNKDLLEQMRDDLRAHSGALRMSVDGMTGDLFATRDTKAGTIVVGGHGTNTYTGSFALVLDTGGDDQYRDGVATVALARDDMQAGALPLGVSVCLDLRGDDEWKTETAHTSLGVGCGAAMAGVAMVADLEGNDTWDGDYCTQGWACYGVGMLIDHAGRDTYTAEAFSGGVAMFGIGLLYDGDGDDTVTHTIYSTGVGLPRGVGCFFDRRGNDVVSTSGENATPQIDSTYGKADGCYHGMGQGLGIGFRNVPGDQQQFPIAGGGVGIVLDAAGNDRYHAGEFAMGCGYFFGFGMFRNVAGNDSYKAGRYGIATGAHQAVGAFVEDRGNDSYHSTSVAAQAGNWDCVVSTLCDMAGNDRYESTAGLCQGSSTITSFALLYDGDGSDTYVTPRPDTLGCGGHNQDADRGTVSFAAMVDVGGDNDTYDRKSTEWNGKREDGEANLTVRKKGETIIGFGVFSDK